MDLKKREERYKCDECSFAFTAPCYLKDHKSSVHSELRPFQCEHCDYSAKLKSILQKHYRTHFPQTFKTQSCPQCPYKCLTRANLERHLRVHTKEKPFRCNICPYRASAQSRLIIHMRTHTGEKPFKCSLCTIAFAESSNLKRHKLFVHNKNNVSLVACSFPGCDRKFTNKYGVGKHVDSVHNREKRFSCPHCEKAFYVKSHCVGHIRHRHTSERPYKCSVCKYVAATSSDVRRHENNTHGEYKSVECPVCHRKYKNDRSLVNHHRNVHRSAARSKTAAPNWKCQEPGCRKEYKTRLDLKRHVKFFHFQLKPFKCLYCNHALATSSHLNTHLKTHTQESPYSCNQCWRCFISSSRLSAHKATAHSELRPFQCGKCVYSAKTNQLLKRHQKIHEPKQTNFNFECNICKESRGSKKPTNYSFCTKIRLNNHIKIAHWNEESFQCSLPLAGAKTMGASIPKIVSKCIKGFLTTEDCPPCFVRLVRKTALQGGSLCTTAITIYA